MCLVSCRFILVEKVRKVAVTRASSNTVILKHENVTAKAGVEDLATCRVVLKNGQRMKGCCNITVTLD